MTLIQMTYTNRKWEVWFQTSSGRRKLIQKFTGKKAALNAAFSMLNSSPNFFKIDIDPEYLKGYSI